MRETEFTANRLLACSNPVSDNAGLSLELMRYSSRRRIFPLAGMELNLRAWTAYNESKTRLLRK